MKKMWLLFCLLLISSQVFAVSNLKLNGSGTHTVTALPADIIVTCDLAQSGNAVEMEIFIDVNGSGTLDVNDIPVEYLILTDGINWIRDPENSEEDIPGDETPVDGKIKTTFPFDETTNFFRGGTFFVKLTDQDGSTATATLIFDIQPQPPYLHGKVTDASTGAAIPGILIFASTDIVAEDHESSFGISDENGDYFINLKSGSWLIATMDFVQNCYMSSDTIRIEIAGGEAKTQDFQLQKYTGFVDGNTKMENGTPVPGIPIFAASIDNPDFSYGNSNESGYYKLGVKPGRVAVSTSMFMTVMGGSFEWPEGYYAEPMCDTVTVAEGQTATLDFIFKPYSTFIEGDCKVAGLGLAGATVSAFSIDFTTGAFGSSQTLTDETGHYKLGVLPGRISMLSASKDGYDMTSPMFGYSGITISEGETITGKDFELSPNSEGISIGGQVTYSNSSAAENVYVVAVYGDAESPEGYQILSTDASGNYEFMGLESGDWKVGVYASGYAAEPSIYYNNLYTGDNVTDADFVLTSGSGVTPQNRLANPRKFQLAQSYPNPFSPGTNSAGARITLYLEQTKDVEIAIYNLTGQLIKRLYSGSLSKGQHQLKWDGRNEKGSFVSSGIYFYRVQAGEKNLTRQLLIVR